MEYVNIPEKLPKGFSHRTFFSSLYQHELGYCIYLPEDYETSTESFPLFYHLHGWTGSEASEIETLAHLCQSRRAITVFPNISPVIEDKENLPSGEMLLHELMPLIRQTFRTLPLPGISGFSMGGGQAFVWAVKHPELFSSVTAYAGTYHHYFPYTDFRTVGAKAGQAADFYQDVLNDTDCDQNILHLVSRQREAVLQNLSLTLHIGSRDVLLCDNEILRLHLEALHIPHEYHVFEGAEHKLADIL